MMKAKNILTITILITLIALLLIMIIAPISISQYKSSSIPSGNEAFSLAIKQAINATPPYKPITLPSTIHMYYVGSAEAFQYLINVGFLSTEITNASMLQLLSLPNDSIVALDWGYMKSLGVNRSLKILSNLIRKNDLVIIVLNTSSFKEYFNVEHVLAVAWGDAYHSKVIGFTVMNLTWAQGVLIVSYGNNYSLAITPLPVSTQGINMLYVRPTLEDIIEYWNTLTGKVSSSSLGIDPSDDMCWQIANSPSISPYVWLFWTNFHSLTDSQGDIYGYDYCVVVSKNLVTSSYASIGVDYIGYEYYLPATSRGEILPITAEINMTSAYFNIDVPNGYNSYMGYVGGIEPSTQSCVPSFNIGFELYPPSVLISIIYQPPQGRETISEDEYNGYSPTNQVPLANVVWKFTYMNYYTIGIISWCSGYQQTVAKNYDNGFEVEDFQGVWVLSAGPNNVNTAASPIFSTSGAINWGQLVTGQCMMEYFGSQLYFILQYNPDAQWSVSQLSGSPYGYAYNSIIPSTCPS